VWLGKRSTRIRARDGCQLIRFAIGVTIVLGATAEASGTTVGPGRIVCNASFCEMGSGARPRERVRVIISGLPHDEIRRLRKCSGVAKPCIVTIDGMETGGPMKIMAEAIHWQD
jgi:hypothetical protein